MRARPRQHNGGMTSIVRGVTALAIAALPALAGAQEALAAPYYPPQCTPVTYKSALGLQPQRVCMNIGVATRGTQPRTYLFASPGGTTGTGAGIFTDNGTLVWWHRPIGKLAGGPTVVHYRGHPYLAVWSGKGTFTDPYGMGSVWLFNQHYQRVGQITAGKPFAPGRIDAHEFQITPQGDALFGIYQPVSATFEGRRVEVYQYVVQKVSLVQDSTGIHTGRVLFQWQSIKHVPLSQSHVAAPINHTVWDYFHGNAISQDSDGNLVVSGKDTWGIYKIDAHTGQIIWQVGAKGDRTLPEPWGWQHDVVALGHSRYSVFDDGAAVPGCTNSAQHPARGLIFEVDPTQRPAGLRLLAAYPHSPSICPGYCGSMQVLARGDVLIDWGNIPELTEYGAAGGNPLMDLSMSSFSCRAYRFPWRGEPLTRPAVAAQLAGKGTRVWASWNGSTELAAWRVLAGSGSAHLRAVGAPRPKHGFETVISLPRRYAAVAVQALSASGRVLATSRTITATRSGT